MITLLPPLCILQLEVIEREYKKEKKLSAKDFEVSYIYSGITLLIAHHMITRSVDMTLTLILPPKVISLCHP